MKSKRVGVLMGGPSSERGISIKSGKAVCKALEARKIEYIPIELMPGSNTDSYKKLASGLINQMEIDVAFVAMHGEFGEDGTVQALLEKMNIPYTGSRSSASRVAMNKITAKEVFKSNNIPIAKHEVLERDKFTKYFDVKKHFKDLGQTLVIKPSNGGSSIGLNIASNEAELSASIKDAFKYDEIGRAHV